VELPVILLIEVLTETTQWVKVTKQAGRPLKVYFVYALRQGFTDERTSGVMYAACQIGKG